MQQAGMNVEEILKRQRETGDRRQDNRTMGEDHRENESQKNRVQHGVVERSGAEEAREENPQKSAGGEPEIAGDETARHEARQTCLPQILPGEIVAQQP